MDDITIVNLLTNSGIKVSDIDADFIYFQDPSCIFPAFDTMLEYAWLGILIMIAIMLLGWGAMYIKNGIKLDSAFNNAKTLLLILCILGAVKPIVNLVYGDDLFGQQCETKQVSRASVNELLEMRNKKFGKSDEYLLYETFNMTDSGIIYTEDKTEDVSNDDDSDGDSTPTTHQENQHNAQNTPNDFTGFEYESKTTIYVKQNGTKVKRVGGSPAWRNNNPGNIRKSKFAYANGAIGETDKWAVFPDEETGLNAITKLLRTQNYNDLSVREAIHKWAPFSDGNNPENYSKQVSKMTGLDADAKIKNLSDSDLKNIARAIQTVEGWIPGTEQHI